MSINGAARRGIKAASPAGASDESRLFERVAAHVREMIDAGTLRAGERVPSVRKLAASMDVSISTVLQAYSRLESDGVILARPQSGYYVRARAASAPPPTPSRPSTRPRSVKTSDLVLEVIHAGMDPRNIRLGAAIADESVMPSRQLITLAGRVSRRAPDLSQSYDFTPGYRPLRVQIARRAIDAGITIGPDELITTCGAQEALSLALRATTRPGDAVCVESPTFYGLLQTIESLHLRAIEVPTSAADGVSLEALGSIIDTHRPKACVFILNYLNPLGACMADEKKRRLVRLLAEKNVPLIEDDIYGELPHSGARPRAAKAFDEPSGKSDGGGGGGVIWCSSVSKTIAPGLRVGWIAPGRYREQIEHLKLTSTLSTPTMPQMMVAEFLATGGFDHHLRKLRRHYALTMPRVADGVREHFPEGTRLSSPTGGYLLWVEMPGGVDAVTLHRLALKRGISIAPGPIFSATQTSYGNCLRLSCGIGWSARVGEAIKTLGTLAKRQLQQRS